MSVLCLIKFCIAYPGVCQASFFIFLSVFMMDGDYSFSFTSGEAYCISMGATMASLEQLTAAKDSGFFRCACVKYN